jgi:hypothetical protein
VTYGGETRWLSDSADYGKFFATRVDDVVMLGMTFHDTSIKMVPLKHFVTRQISLPPPPKLAIQNSVSPIPAGRTRRRARDSRSSSCHHRGRSGSQRCRSRNPSRHSARRVSRQIMFVSPEPRRRTCSRSSVAAARGCTEGVRAKAAAKSHKALHRCRKYFAVIMCTYVVLF